MTGDILTDGIATPAIAPRWTSFAAASKLHAILNVPRIANAAAEYTLTATVLGEFESKVTTPEVAATLRYVGPVALKVTRFWYWMIIPINTSSSASTKLLLKVNPNLS